jgi:hypothetical protein
MMDEALIPIRMFEALGFCPRQAWYRFVSNEDPVNVHMERGLQRHAVFDEAEREVGTVFRAVPVAAPSLGVAQFGPRHAEPGMKAIPMIRAYAPRSGVPPAPT